MTITIRDIAKRAKVSIPTVSRVLGNMGHLHAMETRQRILQAAADMGYRPNTFARAVVTGKFGCLSLLLSEWSHRSNLPPRMVDGILDELDRNNLSLTIAKLPDDKLTDEGYVPKILGELMTDGLLINYSFYIPEEMLRLIRGHDVPSVWINSRQEQNCVYTDYFEGCRRAAEHLIALGHRRIAYLQYSPVVHYSHSDRIAGYEQALKHAGLTPEVFVPSNLGVKLTEEAVKREERPAVSARLLSQRNRPTAFITSSPTTAWPLLNAAKDLGLQVPRDLSVVTFGESLINSTGVSVTTLLEPNYEIGRIAVQMLVEKVNNPGRDLPSRKLQFGFAKGQTCAPPCKVGA